MKKETFLPKIKVGGITRLTTIDFPGYLASVVFMQGCPWRCRYCHNWSLLDHEKKASLSWESVMDFLSRRMSLLDGVVFSGGEPCLWPGLGECIRDVHELGYKVALHTNGAYPDRLASLLESNLIHWAAMDVKAPFELYAQVTGDPHSGENAQRSVDLLVEKGVPCEFRTTFHPRILSIEDITKIADYLSQRGVKHYILQKCRTEYSLDPSLRKETFDFDEYVSLLRPLMEEYFPSFGTR